MLSKFVCKLAVIALVVTGVSADSLYSVAQRNMYTGGRHISVGDVITIFISFSHINKTEITQLLVFPILSHFMMLE